MDALPEWYPQSVPEKKPAKPDLELMPATPEQPAPPESALKAVYTDFSPEAVQAAISEAESLPSRGEKLSALVKLGYWLVKSDVALPKGFMDNLYALQAREDEEAIAEARTAFDNEQAA